MRVLVVGEDAGGAETSVAAALEAAGHEAYPVADPDRARALLAAWRPDRVVVDLAALARWGFPAVRDALEAAAAAAVPAVVVSGADPEDLAAFAARVGAGGAVRRPFPAADLVRAVEEAGQP